MSAPNDDRPLSHRHVSGERALAGAGDSSGAPTLGRAADLEATGSAGGPVIGITMGDPAGIGPEVIVKALSDAPLRTSARFIIYGMNEPIAFAADQAEIQPFWYQRPHDDVTRIASGAVLADFYEHDFNPRELRRPTAAGGRASMGFLEAAMADARAGLIRAIVTGPISKTAWQMAGYPYAGHTEALARYFRANDVCMMFVGGPFRIALASTHVALFELRHSFTIGLVFRPIDLLHSALRDWFGIERPRIAVAGLNPHAGENEQFGDEESRVIEPAIEMARHAGIDVEGPFPADTLFHRAARGAFHGVVALYHDQGLIPVKLLAFEEAVNVTLGLPTIRTSVDHGTAFDIAGKNEAHCGSMRAAITLAIDLARRSTENAAPARETVAPVATPTDSD